MKNSPQQKPQGTPLASVPLRAAAVLYTLYDLTILTYIELKHAQTH